MKEPQLRVLISGINYAPNQFTRAIQRYGCDPIHVKGDPNDNFPRFCDAAIVVSSYTSHARYWAVKEAYKKMGKPVFLVGNGFSEIKESFETFLKTKRGHVSIQPELQQVGELEVPANWVAQTNETETVMEQPRQKGFQKGRAPKRFDPEDRAKINAIVRQGLARNLKHDLIAKQVNDAGFIKTNGTAFTSTDVASLKRQFLLADGTYKQKNKSKNMPGPAAKQVTPTPAPQASAAPTQTFNPMDLIQKVTISQTLTPAEKIELIQRISLGEITTPEKMEVGVVDGNLIIEKTSILRPKSEIPNLTLNREQADLVLAHIADIHKFIQGTLS